MLVAGVVSLYLKKEGAVWVREGRTVDEFQSFHNSVIEIERVRPAPADGKRSVMVIPGSQFADLTAGKARTFTSGKLPFDLVVMNYLDHCEPRREAGPGPMRVDGFRLQELARKNPKTGKVLEHENLMNGAYVKVVDKKSQEEQTGIVWRGELAPWTFKIGDEEYAVSIGRRVYALPFDVTLEKFIRETHPGHGPGAQLFQPGHREARRAVRKRREQAHHHEPAAAPWRIRVLPEFVRCRKPPTAAARRLRCSRS